MAVTYIIRVVNRPQSDHGSSRPRMLITRLFLVLLSKFFACKMQEPDQTITIVFFQVFLKILFLLLVW
jgi:hypothetical protein